MKLLKFTGGALPTVIALPGAAIGIVSFLDKEMIKSGLEGFTIAGLGRQIEVRSFLNWTWVGQA